MKTPAIVTRFAPSPTGRLHLGNARTALFNWLLAQGGGGRMILRIEDTDRERSDAAHEVALMEDLRWLGIDWLEGPDVGGTHAPYRQTEREGVYARFYRELETQNRAYPCFCSPSALAVARKAQLASGKPPRYAGTCARLSTEAASQRIAAGESASLRFRVGDGEVIEFDDLVFGPQRFRSEDIGDFVIRRADGTPSFLFSNAVDDALMGVTHAFRGEDHLANTPRQLLILRALGLRAPHYGHFPLVRDTDGGPLSKRLGSLGLHQLREQGYLPLAIANYLARLGHSFAEERFRDSTALAADFDVSRFGRAPARYDADQLRHWQKEAVLRLDDAQLHAWLVEHADGSFAALDEDTRRAFIAAVRDNIVLPADATHWAKQLLGETPMLAVDAVSAARDAGSAFFRAAADQVDAAENFGTFAKTVAMRTGRSGRNLYMPLRAALTGETHGPEMARIWELLGVRKIHSRLLHAAERATEQ